jgi:azurin
MERIIRYLFVLISFLTACSGNNSTDGSRSEQDTSAQSEPAASADNAVVTDKIELTGNDQMKYNINLIKVNAGDKVTLTLKNIGTMPKEAMAHNFILLAPGTGIEKFAMRAMVSKETDYIPSDMKAVVLAHTKLTGPGESDTIQFVVRKGEYDYICSFPGHYATMKGKLIAE